MSDTMLSNDNVVRLRDPRLMSEIKTYYYEFIMPFVIDHLAREKRTCEMVNECRKRIQDENGVLDKQKMYAENLKRYRDAFEFKLDRNYWGTNEDGYENGIFIAVDDIVLNPIHTMPDGASWAQEYVNELEFYSEYLVEMLNRQDVVIQLMKPEYQVVTVDVLLGILERLGSDFYHNDKPDKLNPRRLNAVIKSVTAVTGITKEEIIQKTADILNEYKIGFAQCEITHEANTMNEK